MWEETLTRHHDHVAPLFSASEVVRLSAFSAETIVRKQVARSTNQHYPEALI